MVWGQSLWKLQPPSLDRCQLAFLFQFVALRCQAFMEGAARLPLLNLFV